ncbi:MAG: BlaI/MecI/CopY family transcriptional regulator [Planctomycetota bacterium]
MSSDLSVGRLQLLILRVLWERGEATVAEVHDALRASRDLAPTTVATMLTKMERKGVVTHRVDARRFVYRATVDETEVHRSMVRDLVDRVFEGDSSALVHHLVREGEIDAGELEDLRARVSQRQSEEGRDVD